MKPRFVYFVALLCLWANQVTAHHKSDYRAADTEFARVVSVTPIYQTIRHRVPEQHCWIETVREEVTYPSATATLVGGIVGGAIGHAVGHGHDNKKIGTVVGSVLGMSIGNDISRKNRDGYTGVAYRDIERCEIRDSIATERKFVGYDVTYEYHNQRYQTQMQRHPGKHIRVAVDVRPY